MNSRGTDTVIGPSIYILIYVDYIMEETWILTLMDEDKLMVFENRVLRRILGPKMDVVTGGWRTLHNEELRHSYSSPSIIRIIKSRRMI
jgi:hypothetical protein